jgi:DNA-binding LytR/AlgR family response regulator
MLKILIIEDEVPAAKRLWKLVKELEPDAILLSSQESVEGSIEWLKQNPAPDLIISDIQLSDGVSFNIFKNTDAHTPVIFTTAYDQYAIEAFKLNSIDYLLKPVKKNELETAITKFKKMAAVPHAAALDIDSLLKAYNIQKKEYKKRFVVRYGEHIKTISIEEIAYFYTEDKINFLTTYENRRFPIDFNLDALENLLDPAVFFRINRQFIISIHAITEMFAYTKSRVLIKLKPLCKHETIVSTERSADFKHWLDDSKEI